MANGKDYYQILGVPKGASQEEIKQAYRKLAREHHPDMVKDGDKTTAETRFKEINEAYQVLSDPQKRKMFDQFGSAGPGFAGGGGFDQGFRSGQWGPFTYSTNGQGFGDIDPFDVFEEFFGFRGFGGRSQRRGKNLAYEIHVSFAEAVHGAEKNINIESGAMVIKIPQGAKNGTELRFAGKGMPGPNGAPSGDLYITIRVETPREFQIVGDNMGIALELEFTQAILGDIVEIPVVDVTQVNGLGKTNLKIPAGTQPGTQFRIRGKGMPRLNGRGQGDVIVQVFVKIPQKVNKKQKELLERYREFS
jgi:DnaJ-class molecular chaperone